MAEVSEDSADEVMEGALSRAVEQGQTLMKKARIAKPTSGNVSRPGNNTTILSKQISTESLATLVHSYHKHFAEYSRTKTRVVQRVPAKVWKLVYADFKEEAKQSCVENGIDFDESCLPAERKLQDGLRAALDPDTGVSDPAGATKVVPQSEEVLMRLKQSDAHARRVMLRHRENIVAGAARRTNVQHVPIQDEPDEVVDLEVATASDGRGDERSAQISNDSSNSRPATVPTQPSRRAPASRNTTALEKMADAMLDLTASATTTGLSMQLIAKTFEEREKSRVESEKFSMRRAKLDEIKWLYENDLISREDFHTKVRAVTDSNTL
jgi:hypothetical protein